MNEAICKNPGDGITSNLTPEDFELDEIEWNATEHPVRTDLLPFKNTIQKILEELEHD
ncbi:MAG: hypothetical protein JXR26_01105 [Balneolaceae bacterium]|nr:hypothetical protein [Balneolaceae bacterium]